MTRMKFKDLDPGQVFLWDATEAGLPEYKVKVGTYLYLDYAANACKHPLRVPGSSPGDVIVILPSDDEWLVP